MHFRVNKTSRFKTLWDRTVGSDPADSWAALDDRYSEPARSYHNWAHVGAMLAGLDSVRGTDEFETVSFDEVELAIFFHDAVYDATAKDNEARSAALFRNLAGANLIIGAPASMRIERMILATRTHEPSDEKATQLLLDLDLAILGSSSKIYDAYVDAVRREYAFVPDDQWRLGRADVLSRFLDRQRIYQSAYFHGQRGHPARDNLQRELETLRGG